MTRMCRRRALAFANASRRTPLRNAPELPLGSPAIGQHVRVQRVFIGGALLPPPGGELWTATSIGFGARLVVHDEDVRLEPIVPRLFRPRVVRKDRVSSVRPRRWFGGVEVRYGPFDGRFLFMSWPFSRQRTVLDTLRKAGYGV